MRHGQSDIGHSTEISKTQIRANDMLSDDFVLEKSIFNNIFEKDIRRVFIYKKAERLAKAIHLITPAFGDAPSLRNRLDAIAIGLVDAAIVPLGTARTNLSRELLALSSVLGIARTGGLLSSMNVDLITREAHILLQEVAAYEEPRLFLDAATTLSDIAKKAQKSEAYFEPAQSGQTSRGGAKRSSASVTKGHMKDIPNATSATVKDRREAVLSVIKNKGTASIKDISSLIRDVSEKTIQRELISLIEVGLVLKKGERRWSTYSLP